jgi:hypothetical protein
MFIVNVNKREVFRLALVLISAATTALNLRYHCSSGWLVWTGTINRGGKTYLQTSLGQYRDCTQGSRAYSERVVSTTIVSKL